MPEKKHKRNSQERSSILPDIVEPLRLATKWLMFYGLCASKKDRFLALRGKTAFILGQLGLYERASMKLLRSVLRPGDLVVDVGANYGMYTALMSQIVGPKGRVLSFEALPDVCDALSNTSCRFDNVTYYNVALSDQPRESVKMHVPLLFGTIPEPALASIEASDQMNQTLDVPCQKLDAYIDRLTGLRFIKVDIEGHEKRFLSGAEEVIRKFRPLLQLEEHEMNREFSWYRHFCGKFDYRLCRLRYGRLIEMTSFSKSFGAERNYYLLPTEKEKALLSGGGTRDN